MKLRYLGIVILFLSVISLAIIYGRKTLIHEQPLIQEKTLGITSEEAKQEIPQSAAKDVVGNVEKQLTENGSPDKGRTENKKGIITLDSAVRQQVSNPVADPASSAVDLPGADIKRGTTGQPAISEALGTQPHATGINTARQDLCPAVIKEIKGGTPLSEITRDKIRDGYDACSVIRCSLQAGTRPQQVMAAAREAGISSDVVSRCSINAYAEFSGLFAGNETCAIIRNDITKGADPRKVMRDKIRSGAGACTVIQCGLASGADPKQVFAGATEAGLTSDVISRCSINAGAEPAWVSEALQNLGMHVALEDEFIPIETDLPGSAKGRFLSPSSF
jgi:hypothetical protein